MHGSAPDIAGHGIANPTALMSSSILMLRHLGEGDAADRLQRALAATFREGTHLTRDLGGSCGTNEFTDAVIKNLV
ncbi:MAG: isocitrate/isopropylmalate family dehydrogenase [Paludibaculum sp.]